MTSWGRDRGLDSHAPETVESRSPLRRFQLYHLFNLLTTASHAWTPKRCYFASMLTWNVPHSDVFVFLAHAFSGNLYVLTICCRIQSGYYDSPPSPHSEVIEEPPLSPAEPNTPLGVESPYTPIDHRSRTEAFFNGSKSQRSFLVTVLTEIISSVIISDAPPRYIEFIE